MRYLGICFHCRQKVTTRRKRNTFGRLIPAYTIVEGRRGDHLYHDSCWKERKARTERRKKTYVKYESPPSPLGKVSIENREE